MDLQGGSVHVPEDVALHIMQMCVASLRDVSAMAGVCKQWRQLIRHSNSGSDIRQQLSCRKPCLLLLSDMRPVMGFDPVTWKWHSIAQAQAKATESLVISTPAGADHESWVMLPRTQARPCLSWKYRPLLILNTEKTIAVHTDYDDSNVRCVEIVDRGTGTCDGRLEWPWPLGIQGFCCPDSGGIRNNQLFLVSGRDAVAGACYCVDFGSSLRCRRCTLLFVDSSSKRCLHPRRSEVCVVDGGPLGLLLVGLLFLDSDVHFGVWKLLLHHDTTSSSSSSSEEEEEEEEEESFFKYEDAAGMVLECVEVCRMPPSILESMLIDGTEGIPVGVLKSRGAQQLIYVYRTDRDVICVCEIFECHAHAHAQAGGHSYRAHWTMVPPPPPPKNKSAAAGSRMRGGHDLAALLSKEHGAPAKDYACCTLSVDLFDNTTVIS